MIEYLFLDIEWNAKNNSKNVSDWEPVQVAAIGADADLKAEKLFAKRVGLKDIETLTENLQTNPCAKERSGCGKTGKGSVRKLETNISQILICCCLVFGNLSDIPCDYEARGDTAAEASSYIDAGNFANDSGGRKESNWF